MRVLDPAVGVDDEEPGLGLQPVGLKLRADALVGVVVVVDLHVDEGGVVADART